MGYRRSGRICHHILLRWENSSAYSCHSNACHGRCVHSPFRLHCRVRDSHARREKSKLYEIKKFDSHVSDDDFRPFRGDNCIRPCTAERDGTGYGGSYLFLSGIRCI